MNYFFHHSFSDAQGSEHDVHFIGAQILREYVRVKNLSLSASCLRLMEKKISVNFVVGNVYRKKFLNKHEKLNRQLYNVNEAFARNPDNIKRVVQLETFFVTDATEAYSINISKVNGIVGEFQFPSVKNQEISLELSGSEEFFYSIKKPFRLATRPFKIKMEPLSSNRVNFNYYTYDNVCYYEIGFELRNTSTIQFPYNAHELCPSETSPRLLLNVVSFFKENPNFFDSPIYKSGQQIKLEHFNGTYILKGFPLVEKLSSAEVKRIISDKDDL